MIQPGVILSERYKIIEKIGTGGMSDVYKAKCTKLNRFVAIKILKDELRLDKNFVAKFKTEAQAAASLSHHNIVNVYDVGFDQNMYYIVMEYVEGITLKQYIKEKGYLPVEEMTRLALQIASGIEHAHQNNIIHRDIKPQNIIISKDGTAKVTDFGIAKAATTATIAVGNITGSVHYFSPEQARGGYSDGKSDIYSLGITMFEMITGQLPFEGDSSISVALLHIQEEMKKPSLIRTDIPQSIEDIILKCTQKKAEKRYKSMNELIIDLKKSKIYPNTRFVNLNDTTESPTIFMTEEDVRKIRNANEQSKTNEDINNYKDDDYEDYTYNDIVENNNKQKLLSKQPENKVEQTQKRGKSFKDSIIITIGVICALLVVGLLISLFLAQPKNVVVPQLVGLTKEQAVKKLEELKLAPNITEKFSEKNKDEVIDQSPNNGIKVKENDKIEVFVSKGIKKVEVPKVTQLNSNEAENLLLKKEFIVEKKEEYHSVVPEGIVIEQSPSDGEQKEKGSKVVITVSKGKKVEKKEVPNLKKLSENEAKVILIASGLKVGQITYVDNKEVPKGQVISQTVAPGTYVEEKTGIGYTVSNGYKEVFHKIKFTIEELSLEEEEEAIMRIELVQEDDKTNVYEGTVTNNDFPFSINVTGKEGDGKINIYINDNLVKTENVDFK